MAVDRYHCCESIDLEIIGDCGTNTGFDLTLERCRNCTSYIMDVYWAGSNTSNVMTGHKPDILRNYIIVRDEVAECLKRIEGDAGT